MVQEDENHVLVARYIFRQGVLLGWFETREYSSIVRSKPETVAVQHNNGEYTFEPPNVHAPLAEAVERLNTKVVFTMNSEIVATILKDLPASQTHLNITQGNVRIPIVQTLDDVYPEIVDSPSCACVVRREGVVLVWSEAIGSILHNGNVVEGQLLSLLCGSDIPSNPMTLNSPGRQSWSRHPSYQSSVVNTPPIGALDEKNEIYMKAVALEDGPNEESDIEAGSEPPPRPVAHVNALKVSLAMILLLYVNGLAVSTLLEEYFWDQGVIRFALLVTLPITALFSLFIGIVIVGSIFQLFMPLGPVLENSKYHSAIKPKAARHKDYQLPHITIQMPVYKEGLRGVIVPTIMSLLAAIQDYERRGGTASIFVNDDGMQAIDPDLAEARKQYYREHNIGYCARPPNMEKKGKKKRSSSGGGGCWPFRRGKKNSEPQQEKEISESQRLANEAGFVRKGKFKKASNMNYCLDFSNRVEDELLRLQEALCRTRGCTYNDLTVQDDDDLYEEALFNMLEADKGLTWAAGNIRIGEVILLVDCDTRVPEDCLYYGALEMHESPEVAIIQHGSGVMQVVWNTFENGITFFTNMIYTGIKFGVGTGDVAPFVGHNAFLRWKAIQSVAFTDKKDGLTKYWSDSHVSEDFDIALRLQINGNIIRLATYHNGGFKEGVSLTVYDELARWEKYAYGCNELMFHPLYKWPYRGPFTRLFLRFLFSSLPITSKVTILAYIWTYYAIGAGFLLTVINYVVFGLFPDNLDHFYITSWEVWITCVVVFNGLSSISFAMLRHRLKEKQFIPAFLEAVKWSPFIFLFFGGLSLHVSRALLCHMFSINIEWTSTAKEMGPTGFFISLDKMVKAFKWIWAVCFLMTGAMIYFGCFAPWGYNITSWTILIPLSVQTVCHFALPIGLGLV